MRSIKLWAFPFAGARRGAVRVAAAPGPLTAARSAERAERVRRLILATALTCLVAMVALAVSARAIEVPAVPIPAGLFELEPLSGLTRLQLITLVSASLAALLVWRRMRRSRRGRAFATSPADQATQTALVAAWVEKAARDVIDRGDQVVGELAPIVYPVAYPAAPAQSILFQPPLSTPDPVAAASFVKWGQEAARAGDRMVAHRLFVQATRLDRFSELAWLWLAGTTDNREEAIDALGRVLEINPDNRNARRGLADLAA